MGGYFGVGVAAIDFLRLLHRAPQLNRMKAPPRQKCQSKRLPLRVDGALSSSGFCASPPADEQVAWPGCGRQRKGPAMSKYVPKIDPAQIVAIDVHTHAETSARAPRDPCSVIYDEAMAKYFKEAGRPTTPQVAQYYRERKMVAVIFTVDSEAEIGVWRSANEEVAELAAENADVLIPFASIDPARGKMGVREARRLVEEYGVRGFKFHPSTQGFYPNDRKAYGLYERSEEHTSEL